MVKIINGEIVQDDDPRLTQRHHRPASREPLAAPASAQQAGGAGAGFSSGFDWNAPAVKVVPRPDAAGGIPDIELFGLRVPGAGLLGVAFAGAFFGLKGLLAAAVLGYLYLRTSGGAGGRMVPTAARAAAAGGASGGSSSSFLMPQQGFGGSGAMQQPPQGPIDKPSSVFRGKAYKLSAS